MCTHFLYQNPGAFTDITTAASGFTGVRKCDGSYDGAPRKSPQDAGQDPTHPLHQSAAPAAFCATPGWDPVTGVGSPKYKELRAIVQALP